MATSPVSLQESAALKATGSQWSTTIVQWSLNTYWKLSERLVPEYDYWTEGLEVHCYF